MDINSPVFAQKFREQIQKIIKEEIKDLKYNRHIQAVVVNEPIKQGYCDIILRHVVGNPIDPKQVIPNVKVRAGLIVHKNDEFYVKAINGSTNNLIVDINKFNNSTNFSCSIKHVNSNYTPELHDTTLIIDSTNNDVEIQLPDANKCDGKVFILKRKVQDNFINVKPFENQYIDNLQNYNIQYCIWIHSAMGNFWIIKGD